MYFKRVPKIASRPFPPQSGFLLTIAQAILLAALLFWSFDGPSLGRTAGLSHPSDNRGPARPTRPTIQPTLHNSKRQIRHPKREIQTQKGAQDATQLSPIQRQMRQDSENCLAIPPSVIRLPRDTGLGKIKPSGKTGLSRIYKF